MPPELRSDSASQGATGDSSRHPAPAPRQADRRPPLARSARAARATTRSSPPRCWRQTVARVARRGLLGLAGLWVAAQPASASDRVAAQAPEGMVGEWFFWPDYRLPGNARNYPGPRPEPPTSLEPIVSAESVAPRFLGEPATQHYTLTDSLPAGSFAIEIWLVDHVNQPIGALAGSMSTIDGSTSFDWVLGYQSQSLVFGVPSDGGRRVSVRVDRGDAEGHSQYWHHLVGVYDGARMQLFHNGTLVGTDDAAPEAIRYGPRPTLSVAGFLGPEPYMDLANLVQYVALYDRALTPAEIRERFASHASRVDNGILFPDLFHFTAGPYLNLVTQHSANVLWETDRPARGRIAWGPRTPLEHTRTLEASTPAGGPAPPAAAPAPQGRLKTVTLASLEANTAYFYRVTATDASGETIDSGLLTFRTAVRSDEPFSFAIVGDTEARPHVNDQLAKLIWGERPHFLLLLGDLTDGGMRNHRFEWTHEFFPGMLQLVSRIPTIAVPGNGEADLYWYRHYHHLPAPENRFAFRFGNAELFILDSNLAYRDRTDPGFRERQREWLDAALGASEATWKIAAHHHPVYTSDENDYGDTWRSTSDLGDVNVRNDFMDLYEQHGVDLVLFGHLHTYERSWPVRGGALRMLDGVIYVQAGGGGGNTEDFAPTPSWFTNRLYRGYHYGIFDVAGPYLEFTSRDAEGRVRDRFALRKGPLGRGVIVGTDRAPGNEP